MTMGSTQALKEMNMRNISWGIRLSKLPLSCAEYLVIGEPQAPGTLRVCLGLYRDHLITRIQIEAVVRTALNWNLFICQIALSLIRRDVYMHKSSQTKFSEIWVSIANG